MRITDISVRALKGSEKYVTHWDATTPGFGIRVGKRSKTWTVMRGRNRERLTIGRYPDLSVAEARAEAKRLLIAAPEAKAISTTFGLAREEFVEGYQNAGTRYLVTRLLRLHFKAIEKSALSDITDDEISRALAKLSDRPSEQLHAYRTLRAFLRWCTRPPRRYIKHSPMEGYEPPGVDTRRSRTLSDDELVRIWRAAERPVHAIFRLFICWGTRNTETVLLRPQWGLDGVLTIPGEHTKNGRDHAIPVLPLAQFVLDSAPRSATHYFGGRWGEGHMTAHALGKLKAEIMEASGTKDWQIRDIRRTFRSNMARLKVPREVAEAIPPNRRR